MVLHHARHRHQRRGRERRAGGRSDATPRGSGGGGGDVDDSGGGGGRRAFGILTRLATTIDEEVTEEELNQIRRRFEDFRTGAQHRRSAECEGLIPASVVALARGPSSPSRRHRHCVATVAWGAFFSTWALASYLMYLCEHDYEIERRRSFIESMRQEEDSGDLASWDSNDDHSNGGGSPPNPDAAEAKSNEFFAWLERYGGCPSEEAAMDPELFWDWWGSVYFTLTLSTSIGFGNFTPLTSSGKVVATLYSVLALPLLTHCILTVAVPLESFIVARCSYHPHQVSMTAEQHRHHRAYGQSLLFNTGLFGAVLLAWIVVVGGVCVRVAVDDSWTFLEAIYFSWIALSSIGLGDFTFRIQDLRGLGVVFLLVGLVLFGEFLTSLTGLCGLVTRRVQAVVLCPDSIRRTAAFAAGAVSHAVAAHSSNHDYCRPEQQQQQRQQKEQHCGIESDYPSGAGEGRGLLVAPSPHQHNHSQQPQHHHHHRSALERLETAADALAEAEIAAVAALYDDDELHAALQAAVIVDLDDSRVLVGADELNLMLVLLGIDEADPVLSWSGLDHMDELLDVHGYTAAPAAWGNEQHHRLFVVTGKQEPQQMTPPSPQGKNGAAAARAEEKEGEEEEEEEEEEEGEADHDDGDDDDQRAIDLVTWLRVMAPALSVRGKLRAALWDLVFIAATWCVVVLYIALGGWALRLLEGGDERRQKDTFATIVQELRSLLNATARGRIVGVVKLMTENGVCSVPECETYESGEAAASGDFFACERLHHDWDLAPATFFAFTVVTTIGYGSFTPYSGPARAFTCAYSLPGLVLVGYALARTAQLPGLLADLNLARRSMKQREWAAERRKERQRKREERRAQRRNRNDNMRHEAAQRRSGSPAKAKACGAAATTRVRAGTPEEVAAATVPGQHEGDSCGCRGGGLPIENSSEGRGRTKKKKDMSADMIKQVHELFELLDGDHNGLVTREEVVAQASLLQVSDAEAAALFDALDVDGDGELSRAEFTSPFLCLTEAHRVEIKWLVCTTLFLCAAAWALIRHFDHPWSFWEACYFIWISTTTIGLGDYVPLHDSMVIMLFMLFVGMALVAHVLDNAGAVIEGALRKAARTAAALKLPDWCAKRQQRRGRRRRRRQGGREGDVDCAAVGGDEENAWAGNSEEDDDDEDESEEDEDIPPLPAQSSAKMVRSSLAELRKVSPSIGARLDDLQARLEASPSSSSSSSSSLSSPSAKQHRKKHIGGSYMRALWGASRHRPLVELLRRPEHPRARLWARAPSASSSWTWLSSSASFSDGEILARSRKQEQEPEHWRVASSAVTTGVNFFKHAFTDQYHDGEVKDEVDEQFGEAADAKRRTFAALEFEDAFRFRYGSHRQHESAAKARLEELRRFLVSRAGDDAREAPLFRKFWAFGVESVADVLDEDIVNEDTLENDIGLTANELCRFRKCCSDVNGGRWRQGEEAAAATAGTNPALALLMQQEPMDDLLGFIVEQ